MRKYYIWTLGCQMNKSDSERVAAVLNNAGLKACSKEEDADLIVVNACSVRQSAIDRIWGKIRIWQNWKKHKKLKTILTGCVLDRDKKKMSDKFDFIIGIKEIYYLPKLLKLDKTRVCDDDYLKIIPKYNSTFQAFVPIMKGCNNFCSYCVVPYVRGREVSRPVEEILSEVKNLIEKGCKDVTLLGQNVNSYQGVDKQGETINFSELIKLVNNIKGDFWLKFITSHPKDMSDELIKIIASSDKISHYIHLPIQAGDNAVLKKMNRNYTVQHYKNLITKIRKALPDAVISTDIIVGFPRETKKQFENTCKLFKEIRFDMAYIAQYSPRSQTAAAKFIDNVTRDEKKRRANKLTEILKETALINNQKLVGQIIDVLVETSNLKSGRFINLGRTKNFKLVKFNSSENLLGQFTKVKIIKAGVWGCLGKKSKIKMQKLK